MVYFVRLGKTPPDPPENNLQLFLPAEQYSTFTSDVRECPFNIHNRQCSPGLKEQLKDLFRMSKYNVYNLRTLHVNATVSSDVAFTQQQNYKVMDNLQN